MRLGTITVPWVTGILEVPRVWFAFPPCTVVLWILTTSEITPSHFP